MKQALVIAAREFEEKRFVLFAAVAFAILPFLLSMIPGIGSRSPDRTIALVSFIAATGFTLGLALITGASFVGRELSDGRMSFYFSRPVGSMSIWFGKLSAGILMIVGCFGIIVAPARLVEGEPWQNVFNMTLGQATMLVLPYALALFLIAHVIGTFVRSRSPLIAFDFAAAVICGVAVRFLILSLAAGQASKLISVLATCLSMALIVAMIGGGAWQIEHGRTDRRRNHLALSQFLWTTMAIALLIAAGWVAWVVSVKISDLTKNIRTSRSPAGPFAVITGNSPGRSDYRAGFLLNTDDGSTQHIDVGADWMVRYTRDGRSVVVPRRAINFVDLLLYRRGSREPIDTRLTIPPGDLYVSDDGGRIASIAYRNLLSVYDVAQKRLLVSVRLPDVKYARGVFVSPDVLRLYLDSDAGTRIAELDVRSRVMHDTVAVASKPFDVHLDSSAARMLVSSRPVTLNDGRTGAPIKTLPGIPFASTASFLRDGRIAVVDDIPFANLHIFSSDGTLQRDIPIGSRTRAAFVGDDGTRVVLALG